MKTDTVVSLVALAAAGVMVYVVAKKTGAIADTAGRARETASGKVTDLLCLMFGGCAEDYDPNARTPPADEPGTPAGYRGSWSKVWNARVLEIKLDRFDVARIVREWNWNTGEWENTEGFPAPPTWENFPSPYPFFSTLAAAGLPWY